MIIIYDCNNKPPTVVAPDDTCLWAGDSIFRTITAKDPDIGDKVTLTAQGGPLYLSTNPAVLTLQPAGNPVTGYFSWQTTCEHIRATAYSATFRAEDDFEIIVPPPGKDIPAPAVALETWYITIVAPPVQNLQADASGNDILLTWDLPYVCEGASNFKGFAIWRKQTCDTSDIDSCVTGLAGKGYTKINTVNTFSYSYLDELVNRGIVYSYRVLAEFYKSNGINSIKLHFTESIPSNGVCEELSKNIPIITNVSVNITDRNNGEIYIKWTKPLADFASDSTHLDTTEITGPYVYKLYRSNGFFGSNPVQITSFTSPTFGAFNDSDYTDIGINTVDGPFSYTLEFYGETTVLIGTADVASSVYLSFAASDNRLDLTWVEYVPWLNYEYDIYRFNQGTLMWNNIGTSGTPSFSDLNLTNGREYCYYIESHGRFTSAGLPTNLLNLSQENCGIPIDTIPPCPPGLNIMTSCDFIAQNLWNNKYENILTWTNPNNYCADDVIQYNIYYKPNEGVDFTLLTSTFVATDTTYTHLRDIVTLAGCYAVTAIDSFYNESDLSEIICVDNCPIYELPNVFTPNSDGMNEHFTPFYPYRFIDHIDITIFNRWGQLVYSTNDPNIKWNGRYNGTGRPLSSGVYFYVCEVYEVMLSGVEKRTKPLTGFVHIIVSPPSSN